MENEIAAVFSCSDGSCVGVVSRVMREEMAYADPGSMDYSNTGMCYWSLETQVFVPARGEGAK